MGMETDRTRPGGVKGQGGLVSDGSGQRGASGDDPGDHLVTPAPRSPIHNSCQYIARSWFPRLSCRCHARSRAIPPARRSGRDWQIRVGCSGPAERRWCPSCRSAPHSRTPSGRRGVTGDSCSVSRARRLHSRPRHVGWRPGQGMRVSRLLLLSDDGAERLYRHAERLAMVHAPRVLAAVLAADGAALGRTTTGREVVVKAMLAQHKLAVAALLRALTAWAVAPASTSQPPDRLRGERPRGDRSRAGGPPRHADRRAQLRLVIGRERA
jgi:hypothetical protein